MQKKKGDDIEGYPDCFTFAKRVHEGLRSVHIVVGTSIGHTHSMESVLALFKAAMNYRHDVFSAQQKAELESWVRGSRVLKIIIEEKERDKAERAGIKLPAAPAGANSAGVSAGGSGAAASGDMGKVGDAVQVPAFAARYAGMRASSAVLCCALACRLWGYMSLSCVTGRLC